MSGNSPADDDSGLESPERAKPFERGPTASTAPRGAQSSGAAPQRAAARATRASSPPPAAGERRGIVTVAILAALTLAAFLILRGPADPMPDGSGGGGAGTGGYAGGSSGGGGERLVPFCTSTPDRKVLGVRADGTGPVAPPSQALDADVDEDALLAPSGVAVGRACATSSGVAVGIKRDGASGSVGAIARMDLGAVAAPPLPIGPVRGDLDAPSVFADGDRLVVALLEPDAAGYSLRVGWVDGDAVRWTEDLPQRRDESLAFDLAFGPSAVVVTWDESDRGGERTQITLATLDRTTLRVDRAASRVSAAASDGELPRIVARPGGFWLAYVARKPAKLAGKPTDSDLQRAPDEERHSAELIEPSWIDIVPLDDTGAPIGPPRAATARSGHAQEFDIHVGSDGGALITWQDDDTPTGAQGGELYAVAVTMAGVAESHLVVEEGRALGGPRLFGPWLLASDAQGQLWQGRLDSSGRVLLPLRPEPALGRGQPLAVAGDDLLVARPAVGGVDLELVRCQAAVAAAPQGNAAPASSARLTPVP